MGLAAEVKIAHPLPGSAPSAAGLTDPAAALEAAGVPHTLVAVPGASHYLDRIIDFTADGPLWEFLDVHLRSGGN